MLICVDSIEGDIATKLRRSGWRRHRRDKAERGTLDAKYVDKILGKIFEKDFPSMSLAIRGFELATGIDAISATDHDGVPIYTFSCVEQQLVVSGWECGKHLFKNWHETPRKCLEALNEAF